MKLKKLILTISISTLSMTSVFANVSSSVLPQGINNGAYVYDQSYRDTTKVLTLGSMSKELAPFIESNTQAFPNHKTLLYTYGTDLELSCKNTSDPSTCVLNMYYSHSTNPYYGRMNTQTYASALNKYNKNIEFAPIVEGGFWGGGLLVPMEKMTQPQINHIADQVAQSLCADDNVSGISFDLEPFNGLPNSSQTFFYQEIGKDLAGKNPSITNCVNTQHPNGRFFSVFLSPNQTAATIQVLSSYLNAYHNGYAILSFYNLGGTNLDATAPDIYNGEFKKDLNNWLTLNNSLKHNNQIKYQVAIPAGSDDNEFEYCQNLPFHTKNCISTTKPDNYTQMTYVTDAITNMNNNNLQNDDNFMGVTLWAFQPEMVWKGVETFPASASPESYAAVNKAKL